MLVKNKESECKVNEALDLAIKLLDIKPVDLAKKSGVSASQISRYRNGDRDIGMSSFAALLRVMPDNARKGLIDCLEGKVSKEEFISRILAA